MNTRALEEATNPLLISVDAVPDGSLGLYLIGPALDHLYICSMGS